MRELSFLLGLALLALTVACGGGGQAEPPPAGTNAIVFAAGWQYHSDLYIMSAHGGTPRQLTSGEEVEGWPLWSPDGTQIAFLRIDARGQVPARTVNPELSERLGLVTIQPDGRGERVLAKGAPYFSYVAGFGWSPDGQRIAYSALEPTDEGVKGGIFIVDSGGGAAPVHLVTDPTAVLPAWSPDGTQIAFVSDVDFGHEETKQIFVVQADGTNVRQVAGGPRADFAPVWSPDGRRIAWWGQDADGLASKLFTAPAEGGEAVDLGTGRNPVWSPDGKKIALTDVGAGANDDVEVLVVDVETGERTNLTNSPARDMWPTWSPDGKRIAFVSDRDDERGEIYVMNADGSRVRRLTENDLAEDMLAWSPQ